MPDQGIDSTAATSSVPPVAFRRRSVAVDDPLRGIRGIAIETAAEAVGVSYMTLYRAIRESGFPGVKVRGRIVVPVRAVEMLFDSAVQSGTLVDAAEWTASWTASLGPSAPGTAAS